MSKEIENLNGAENSTLNIADSTFRITVPLEMIWQPKEDITTYELAMCVPYFFRHHGVMPYEVDMSLSHFRHFKIIDRNVMYSYKGLPKPKLEDFYDTNDPRGCSSSEYEDYLKAVKKWKIENNYV